MFSEYDPTEHWVDDHLQRTTFHKIRFDGPFDQLPDSGNEVRVKWQDVPGTNSRYEAGLSLNTGATYVPTETLSAQAEEYGLTTYIGFHLKQCFWKDDTTAKGTSILTRTTVLGNDGAILRPTSIWYNLEYDSVAVNSWRLWTKFLSIKTLFSSPSTTATEQHSFFVSLEIIEPVAVDLHVGLFPHGLLYQMADSLLSPNDGDIRFDCPCGAVNEETKSLYAHIITLSDQLIAVFASAFAEGDAWAASGSSDTDASDVSRGPRNSLVHRRIITMEEEFDVVHNILYYIYTNRIIFSTIVPTTKDSDPSNEPIVTSAAGRPDTKVKPKVLPRVTDTEDIFALAHRLDLVDLQKLALAFLGKTCNDENITSRVFSQFAAMYDEVAQVYDAYFKEGWPRVAHSNEFKQYFAIMEEENNSQEIIRIFGKFRELVLEAVPSD